MRSSRRVAATVSVIYAIEFLVKESVIGEAVDEWSDFKSVCLLLICTHMWYHMW